MSAQSEERETLAQYWENYAKACRATGPEPEIAHKADATATVLREPVAAPRAGVPVEALKQLIGEWRKRQIAPDVQGSTFAVCAMQLAALVAAQPETPADG